MNADVKGAYAQLNKSWKAFTHNGEGMTKNQVKLILEHAIKRGYETTDDIPGDEIDQIPAETDEIIRH